MMSWLCYCFFLQILHQVLSSKINIDHSSAFLNSPQQPLHKISFGSCNRHSGNQSIWNSIANEKPDLWIWLGDVVYADVQVLPVIWRSPTMDEMRKTYHLQKEGKEYTLFRKTCPVIGVWDDHDYGKNDGGEEYPEKDTAKEIFLDFIDVPKNGQQWEHPGIYAAYDFGPQGQKVRIILLDVRYFRTTTQTLGDLQWEWLEKQLKDSDAQVHIIGSGSQILPSDKPFIDKWSPEEIKKLSQLIKKYSTPGVILISGDVHHGEILLNSCSDYEYPLYEATSSGMTHSFHSQASVVGSLAVEHVLSTERRLGVYCKENFGTITFNWTSPSPSVSLQIHTVDGAVALQKVVSLKEIEKGGCKEGGGCSKAACTTNYGLYEWRLMSKKVAKIVLFVGGVGPFCLGVLLVLLVLWKKRKASFTASPSSSISSVTTPPQSKGRKQVKRQKRS